MGFSKGLKNEFESAVVFELSVFEPLKVNSMLLLSIYMRIWVAKWHNSSGMNFLKY